MNMEYLKIDNHHLEGIIHSSGSKNIALPLICASLLSKGVHHFSNVPDISDVRTLLIILSYLHVESTFKEGKLILDTTKFTMEKIPKELIQKLRASYYLLGVLLPQVKELEFTYPGGCSFQERPIDYHLKAFNSMGVEVVENQENLYFKVNNLQSIETKLPRKSVGTTINILFFSLQIKGITIINNPSLDYEVKEVINYLNKVGAYIEIKDNQLIVYGGKKTISTNYFIPYDRIEIGSFALYGAALGRLLIIGIDQNSLQPLFNLFDLLKVNYSYDNNYLLVEKTNINTPIKITLSSDPFLHTDLGPILCAYLMINKKISIIEDKIYPMRNSYVEELVKLGAKIKIINNKIIIFPNSKFKSAYLYGKDLRGMMGLILGALISNKSQELEGYFYLTRGYENILDKFKNINVNIRRLNL